METIIGGIISKLNEYWHLITGIVFIGGGWVIMKMKRAFDRSYPTRQEMTDCENRIIAIIEADKEEVVTTIETDKEEVIETLEADKEAVITYIKLRLQEHEQDEYQRQDKYESIHIEAHKLIQNTLNTMHDEIIETIRNQKR